MAVALHVLPKGKMQLQGLLMKLLMGMSAQGTKAMPKPQ